MFIRLMALLLLISLPFAGKAEEICFDTRKWSKEDSILLAIQLSLTTVDMGQTMNFTQNLGVAERNPLFPKHPTRNQVRAIWIGSMAGQTAIAVLLPKPWRNYFQVGMIAGETIAVLGNVRLGLGITIPW